MNLGVVGSRSITDSSTVEQAIQSSPWYQSRGMIPPEEWGMTIVSGGADGVDTRAEEFAENLGLPTQIIEPDYSDWSNEHPAKARNTEIVKESDAIVAVWDGRSNGTRDTIDKALDRGVPIYVEVVE